MELPTFGSMYLREGATDKATLHHTLSCETIVEIVRRSAPGGVEPDWAFDPSMVDGMFQEVTHRPRPTEWEWVAHNPRRFCRVCALEHVMGQALKRIGDERITAMTISPWPALPKKARGLVKLPRPTQRAAERMNRLAAHLGGFTVEGATPHATVLVVDVPNRALELLHRNMWAVQLPPEVERDADVISTAWSLFAAAQGAPSKLTQDDTWQLARAAHATL